MLIRRHRATPEVDERFKLKPSDTLDPAFKNGAPEAPAEVPELTPEDAATMKGAALDDALRARGLPLSGTADEKRVALVAAVTPDGDEDEATPDGDEDEAGATEPTSVGDDGVEPETPADGEDDLI